MVERISIDEAFADVAGCPRLFGPPAEIPSAVTCAYFEVEEIKSIPYVPVSHPFVERLIGTIRREFLDHVLIWNAVDLGRKLEAFRNYYNENRVHQSLSGSTPGERSGQPPPAHAVLDHYAWRYHCRGLFQMPIAA